MLANIRLDTHRIRSVFFLSVRVFCSLGTACSFERCLPTSIAFCSDVVRFRWFGACSFEQCLHAWMIAYFSVSVWFRCARLAMAGGGARVPVRIGNPQHVCCSLLHKSLYLFIAHRAPFAFSPRRPPWRTSLQRSGPAQQHPLHHPVLCFSKGATTANAKYFRRSCIYYKLRA